MRLSSIVMVLLTAASAAMAPDETKPAEPIQSIGWMVGNWTIDTHWLADGKDVSPLKARNAIVWGPGHKFIVSDTFVSKTDGTEYHRYHDVFASENGKITGTSFAIDGEVSQGVYTSEGLFLRTERDMPGADGKPSGTLLRQELERTDDGTAFHWRVWLVKDGKLNQIMNGTWHKA